MLEILIVLCLCVVNARNAIARGRNPLGFIGLTLGLWLGLRITGVLIGFYLGFTDMYAYGVAFVFGFCGGIMAYGITRHCGYADH